MKSELVGAAFDDITVVLLTISVANYDYSEALRVSVSVVVVVGTRLHFKHFSLTCQQEDVWLIKLVTLSGEYNATCNRNTLSESSSAVQTNPPPQTLFAPRLLMRKTRLIGGFKGLLTCKLTE